MAVLLVASTLVLTYLTFGMAGQPSKMQDAMGVLTLMFGLAGVVVGYYFGRVPSDARAADAHQTTQMAMTTMRDMSGASSVANQMAEKTRQIRANLNADMDTANMTSEKLKGLAEGASPAADEVKRLAEIVVRLQRQMNEL